MLSPLAAVTDSLLEQAHSNGYAAHGDLDLTSSIYAAHVLGVVEKRFGSRSAESVRLYLLKKLHITDLYLSIACARRSEKAWHRFDAVYRKYIFDLAAMVCRSRSAAGDLAGDILCDMFMPDRSGQSRIASYDGQVSLFTWLRAIVMHRAINERERKWNSVERLDDLPEIADPAGVRCIETALRSSRYDKIVEDAIRTATRRLSERERLVLVLRYVDSRQSEDIARFIGVHPSRVSHRLKQTHIKLRKEIESCLATKHHLGDDAIEECIDDIMENPAHSILSFLKESQS